MLLLISLLVFGVCFLILGLSAIIIEHLFFKTAVLFSGRVIDCKQDVSLRGLPIFAPVVEFEFGGKVQIAKGKVFSVFKPKIGQEMTVGLNPKNTDQSRVKQRYLWFISIYNILLGLLCLFAFFITLSGPAYKFL